MQVGLVLIGIMTATGCDRASQTGDQSAGVAQFGPKVPDAPDSSYQFESAVMLLQSEGEPISVQSPGYACPTVADIDGDGADDLIVGQFASGKMKWYRNTAGETKSPEYAVGQWIQSDDQPAQVPGVS